MRTLLLNLMCSAFLSLADTPNDVTILGRVDAGDYEVRVLNSDFGFGEIDFEVISDKTKLPVFSCIEIDDVQDIGVFADGKQYWYGRSQSGKTITDFKDSLDFDNDGTSEVVVETIVAGQGCCSAFYVFKVSPAFRLVGQLSSARYGGIGDLDNDGETEISVADDSFMLFENVCDADSPILYVPHHFANGDFVPDIAAMKAKDFDTRGPSLSDNEAIADFASARSTDPNSVEAQDIPPVIWVPVVCMWYRGKTIAAREYFDLAWPAEVSGKEDFWKKMLGEAKKSPYWKALQELNGWVPQPKDDVRLIHAVSAGLCTFEIYERPVKSAFVPKVFQLQVKTMGKTLIAQPPNPWKEEDFGYCYIELLANQKSFSTETKETDDARLLDFDEDGIQEVVLIANTGGQGCCNEFYVIKVAPAFRQLGYWQSDGYGEVSNDGTNHRPIVSVGDGTFYAWQMAPHSGSPTMYVPLRYFKGKFEPDVEAMRRPNPDPIWIAEASAQAKDEFAFAEKSRGEGKAIVPGEVPPILWAPVARMWYEGNTTAARKYFDDNWPVASPGKEEFWKEMLNQAKTSPYWDAIKTLNGW